MTSLPPKRPLEDDDPLSASSSNKAVKLSQDELAPTDRAARLDRIVEFVVLQEGDGAVDGDNLKKPLYLFEAIISQYKFLYKAQNPRAYCVIHEVNAARLLEGNPLLEPALQKAWKERSFSEITSSVFFQKGPDQKHFNIEVQNQVIATQVSRSLLNVPHSIMESIEDALVSSSASH